MSFRYFDHTGDIGVRLTGRTLDALFRDAAAAFTESVAESARVRPRESLPVALEAPAVDLLLVDWLSEILYCFEVKQILVADADVRVTGPSGPELKLGAYDGARHDAGTGLQPGAYDGARDDAGGTGLQPPGAYDGARHDVGGTGLQPGARLSVWRLQATLRGEVFDPARHQIKVLIKAVTHHALEVREDEHGWRATVVFDI